MTISRQRLLIAVLVLPWLSLGLLAGLDASAGLASEETGPMPEDTLGDAWDEETGGDAIARPPAQQVITSPNGSHILVLRAPENSADKRLVATFYTVSENLCQPQWSQTLPQEYGPRFVLVNDQGYTVLLDEWINVASSYAVMVLDPSGQVVAQHSFDQVASLLRVPRADVVEQARFGWWISAAPTLNRSGTTVRVPTAGRQLQITVATGQLRR